jgi:uncharacterized membrane protein YebE (DUF533 family)
MGMKQRKAIIGLLVYQVAMFAIRRMMARKGGSIMAGKRKYGIIAAIGAALAGLAFWRRRQKKAEVTASTPSTPSPPSPPSTPS